MVWKVELEDEAKKELKHIDKQHAKRILQFLHEKIAGNWSGLWRYRINDYRVICDIQDTIITIIVIRIGHRKDVYKH